MPSEVFSFKKKISSSTSDLIGLCGFIIRLCRTGLLKVEKKATKREEEHMHHVLLILLLRKRQIKEPFLCKVFQYFKNREINICPKTPKTKPAHMKAHIVFQ